VLISSQTGVMAKDTLVHQPRAKASRDCNSELHVNFRGYGPALTAIAQSRRVSKCALVRAAVGEWLKSHAVDVAPTDAKAAEQDESVSFQKDAPLVRTELYMPAYRATLLARQARAAALSRGMYVAQLLDTQSDDLLDASPRETLAAVVRSNAELAAIYGDLLALAHTLKHASSLKPADLDVLVEGLSKELGRHLAFTAPRIAALPATWRRAAKKPD